jgi:hypothetical protein
MPANVNDNHNGLRFYTITLMSFCKCNWSLHSNVQSISEGFQRRQYYDCDRYYIAINSQFDHVICSYWLWWVTSGWWVTSDIWLTHFGPFCRVMRRAANTSLITWQATGTTTLLMSGNATVYGLTRDKPIHCNDWPTCHIQWCCQLIIIK